jgi:hypothetical protein
MTKINAVTTRQLGEMTIVGPSRLSEHSGPLYVNRICLRKYRYAVTPEEEFHVRIYQQLSNQLRKNEKLTCAVPSRKVIAS